MGGGAQSSAMMANPEDMEAHPKEIEAIVKPWWLILEPWKPQVHGNSTNSDK